MGRNKNPEIDVGLEILSRLAAPGDTLTLREIADVCGCHPQNIAYIENRALKKLHGQFLQRGFGQLDPETAPGSGRPVNDAEKRAIENIQQRFVRPGTGRSVPGAAAPRSGAARPCSGRLVKNEKSSSDVADALVCMWCGATFEATAKTVLGQPCKRSYLPVKHNGLFTQDRAAEASGGRALRRDTRDNFDTGGLSKPRTRSRRDERRKAAAPRRLRSKEVQP
jgi:hypothetical protein